MTFFRTCPVSADDAAKLAVRALEDEMQAQGVADAHLAGYLGCDEKTVRKVLSRKQTFSHAMYLRLPERLRAGVDRRLAAAFVQGRPAPDLDAQMRALLVAANDVSAVAARVVASHGAPSPELRTRLARALAAFDTAADPLRVPHVDPEPATDGDDA